MILAETIILGIDGGILKAIALVTCFVIFVSIAVWLAFSRSPGFQRAAQIPLEDEYVAEAADGSADRGVHQSGLSRND